MDLAVLAEPEVATVHTSVSSVSRGRFVPVKASSARTDEVTTLVNGVAYTTSQALPVNIFKVRAYNSGGGNIADNTSATKVPFDTVTTFAFDTANGFNTATNSYKVPVGGYYVLATLVTVVTGTIAADGFQSYYVNFYVNGAEAQTSGNQFVMFNKNAAPNIRNLGIPLTDTLYLNQNDIVDVRISTVGCSVVNASFVNVSSAFNIHLLSR